MGLMCTSHSKSEDRSARLEKKPEGSITKIDRKK